MSDPIRPLRSGMLALLAVWLLAGSAAAQEPEREWKAPHKNGHTFSVISGVPDAFVRSHVLSTVGVAQSADTEFPLGIVDGDTLFASTGGLVFANLGLEYQQKIRDWIAFRGQLRILGRLGSGTAALLSSGVSATVGFELGWLLRLLETERGYLSGSFDVRNSSFTTINIADFVNDIIEGEDAELVRKTPSMRAGVGLRYTYAFSPLVGLVSFAETGFGEPVDETEDDEWFFRFGATVDFDLAATGWLPVGLAAGYSQDSFPEGGSDITDVVRTFLFRIGYTGREDLALGVNVEYAVFPTNQLDRDVNALGGAFEIRYYF